jgi:Flp pilus assembly protein TadD
MSDPVFENTSLAQQIAEARMALTEGQFEIAAIRANVLWLENVDDEDLVELYADILQQSGRPEPANKVRNLLDNNDQALALFEAGFALIDVRQYDLAAMLLTECDKLTPDDPGVNYELGFAMMALGGFAQAIGYFEKAMKIQPEFDSALNLSVCYLLTRDLEKSKLFTNQLSALAKEDDEVKETTHRKIVLKRAESFAAKKVLTAQDWLFILYGSVLLKPHFNTATKPDDHKAIAEILLILKGFFEGMRQEIEVIEYYNTQSRPLARVLSEIMEITLDSYKGPNRPEKVLLVMDWASDIIGPHDSFIDNSDKRLIFAYGLPGTEPLPLVPDINAYLCSQDLMPWNDVTKADADMHFDKILDKARNMESDPDVIKAVEDLLIYFEPRKKDLVMGNSENFPDRPEYSAEIPVIK